jgi:hypothetical protein
MEEDVTVLLVHGLADHPTTIEPSLKLCNVELCYHPQAPSPR